MPESGNTGRNPAHKTVVSYYSMMDVQTLKQLSRRSCRFLLLFLLAGTTSGWSQQLGIPVQFDGEIRARSEANGRDFNNTTDLNTYTLLRTRFGARALPREDVSLYIQVQDSRAFGTQPETLSSSSNVDLHQAYFEINNLWNHPLQLRVGRQELSYGAQRIVGPENFSNVGRSFEGLKLTFGRDRNLDLFGMIINESSPPGTIAGKSNNDFDFFGLYYSNRNHLRYKFDAYAFLESNLMETAQGDNELGRVTIGTYNERKLGSQFDLETEVAYQFGQRRGQTVSAYMLTGSLGFTIPAGQNPEVRVGIDYLSGMDGTGGNYKVFDTLFATNHRFYGFMDFFHNLPIDTANQGLRDLMLKVKFPLTTQLRLDGHYHNFHTASGPVSNFGDELDLVLSYVYNAVSSFQFGASFFLPGERMKRIFNKGDIGMWSHVTLLVKF